MASRPHEPLPGQHGPPYRLLVRARAGLRQRDFMWEIIRDSESGTSVSKASAQSFKTMEEAYAQGSIALDRFLKSV